MEVLCYLFCISKLVFQKGSQIKRERTDWMLFLRQNATQFLCPHFYLNEKQLNASESFLKYLSKKP